MKVWNHLAFSIPHVILIILSCDYFHRVESEHTHAASAYSLRVTGGPGQLDLLEDEDGSGDVIRRALHLVRGQREEIRPAVPEPGREIRGRLGRARARSHDAADDVGDRGPHACHHHDDVAWW